MRNLLSPLAGIVLALLPALTQAEMTLLMAEEDGCAWCRRWDAEISEIYPKTPEGKAAPLQRMDIGDALPEGIKVTRPLHFTPTFILLKDGRELNRIEGYPGEDFFWGLLGMMLREAGALPPSG